VRVLFTSIAGAGHVHPLVALAQAVRRRGHEVVFAVHPDYHAALAKAELRTVAAGMSNDERFARMIDELGVDVRTVPHRQRGDVMFPQGFGTVAMPRMVEDLRQVVSESPPDLIVHDAAELAAVFVAAELKVHHVTHSFGTTPPMHRAEAAGQATKQFWDEAGLEQPPASGLFSDVYVDIRPPALPGHPPAGTHTLLERPTAGDTVGGAVPDIVTTWDGRPLVYVTIGTVTDNPELLRLLLDVLARFDLRALVTVGPKNDPAGLGATPDNVTVVSYVPQAQVLPHCTVVVSHAGSGTFLGSLTHGLPMLCLPHGADQFLNADAASEVGCGVTLEPHEIDAETVAAALSDLLLSPSYARAAKSIAEEIATMPTADEVAAQLEQL
jgi:UDP:flavonoid glycosyltransferase YjiC (YdhE family)